MRLVTTDKAGRRGFVVDSRQFLRLELASSGGSSSSSSSSTGEWSDEEPAECRGGTGAAGHGGEGAAAPEVAPEPELALPTEEMSRWLLATLRPRRLARLDPATLLPVPGEATEFDPGEVYAHRWKARRAD